MCNSKQKPISQSFNRCFFDCFRWYNWMFEVLVWAVLQNVQSFCKREASDSAAWIQPVRPHPVATNSPQDFQYQSVIWQSHEQLPACAQFNFPGPSWASTWNAQNFPWTIFIPQQLAQQYNKIELSNLLLELLRLKLRFIHHSAFSYRLWVCPCLVLMLSTLLIQLCSNKQRMSHQYLLHYIHHIYIHHTIWYVA